MPEPSVDNPLAPPGTRPSGGERTGDEPLRPPDVVAAVPHEQAAGLVPLTSEVRTRLDSRARAFVEDLVAADPHSPEFARRITSIATMGEADLRASSQVAGRMLQRPAANMSGDATGRVAGLLAALRRTVADLDPSRVEWEGARGVRRLVSGDPAGRYFARYRAAQDQLDALIAGLVAGQDELRQDNAAIDTERAGAQATLAKLSEYAALAAALDEEITAEAVRQDNKGRPEAADVLRSEALAAVRQRRQDVLTHLAVVVQGYLALDVVKRNNVEMVRAVERARTATVAILRAAVAAAHAAAAQPLVLDRIRALDAASAEELRGGVAGSGGSGPGEGGVERLQRAFAELMGTMEAIDGYRDEAVTNMAATTESLRTQIGRAQRNGDAGR